nr:MAG TPA: hypothetical protein [Caudoviricetes sp.]
MSKLRDWFNKTPTVDGPTKEELRKANSRLTHLAGGGSYVERPPRTDKPQLPKIKDYSPNYNYDYNYDYVPFSAPFPPTAEEMIRKGYIKQIPSHWNKEIKEKIPPQIKKDIMKEIEWEYSEEGAKELRHLFAMWHLNDEVWQRQRRKAINLAVYGDEDPFNEKPYYHIISFSDEYGFKLTQYPKHQKEEAHALFNNYNESWHTPNNVFFFEGEEIGHIITGGKL